LIFKFDVRKLFWLYFSAIVLLVILPINSAGELNNITILRLRGDYFLHALLFVPWAFFYPAIKSNKLFWLLYGFLFAAGSEAIQYLLPYRAFNINDLIANIIGVMTGVGVVRLVQRSRGKTK
jgi:glycopeptide antibiotics resistance protein